MPTIWDRFRRAHWLLYAGLILFVLAWLVGPADVRDEIPIWIPFLVALGLEVFFFVEAQRAGGRSRLPDRGPQAVDRERYGYDAATDDLILVRTDDGERWIPATAEALEDGDEGHAVDLAPYVAGPRRFVAARRLVLGLAVIAAIGAVAWYVDSRRGWSGLDSDTRAAAAARFSSEASLIAGHQVRVRCDESGRRVGAVQHSDGVAIVGGDLAYLTPERCYDLYRLAFNGDISFSRTARAIAVLAHESVHLHGVRNEGTTECYALQQGVALGRRLGLSDDTARRMMRQQLVENAGRGAASEYAVGRECRNGGKLDLDPASSEFP